MASKDPLVWVDCEMGGLDIDVHNILEIAVIITDSELNTIAEHDTLYIHQTEEQIAQFDPWCVEQHGKSGLTELVRSSKTSIEDADNQIYDFLKKHIPQARVACLAGNTVHIDKRFMDKLMPKTMSHLHYRIVDVSSLKELARRWYPEELAKAPKKKGKHRALDDIKESIAELKYYRSVIFKQPTTSLRRHGK